MVDIPAELSARVSGRPNWADWFAALPATVQDLLAEWQLRVDGRSLSGDCALVVPVRTADGRAGALKVSWPHWEAETEHLALRAWAGDGAVELWRADPHRFALLLERAVASRDLTSLPAVEASEVVAGFYRRLHRPASPQFRRLSDLCVEWAERMPALETANLVPRRLVGQARSLLHGFAADPGTDGRLVHTDLHFFNVLAAEREPWLVIDPKPLSGDPAYEVAPLLWNRHPEAAATGSVRTALLDRLDAVVDVGGLDEDRVRDWVVVRGMCNALWEFEAYRDHGTPVSADYLTWSVTMAKAVQR